MDIEYSDVPPVNVIEERPKIHYTRLRHRRMGPILKLKDILRNDMPTMSTLLKMKRAIDDSIQAIERTNIERAKDGSLFLHALIDIHELGRANLPQNYINYIKGYSPHRLHSKSNCISNVITMLAAKISCIYVGDPVQRNVSLKRIVFAATPTHDDLDDLFSTAPYTRFTAYLRKQIASYVLRETPPGPARCLVVRFILGRGWLKNIINISTQAVRSWASKSISIRNFPPESLFTPCIEKATSAIKRVTSDARWDAFIQWHTKDKSKKKKWRGKRV